MDTARETICFQVFVGDSKHTPGRRVMRIVDATSSVCVYGNLPMLAKSMLGRVGYVPAAIVALDDGADVGAVCGDLISDWMGWADDAGLRATYVPGPTTTVAKL